MQENFEEVMKLYPASFHAMDLVAQHRLRALHASTAFAHKQQGAAAGPPQPLSLLPLWGCAHSSAFF